MKSANSPNDYCLKGYLNEPLAQLFKQATSRWVCSLSQVDADGFEVLRAGKSLRAEHWSELVNALMLL